MGRIAGRRVVQRRGNRALHVDHVVMAELVQLFGCDTGFYVRLDGRAPPGEPAGDTHLLDVFRGFDGDTHNFRFRLDQRLKA